MKVFDDCNVKSEKFQDSMFEEIGNLNTIDAQQRRAERDVQKQKHRLVQRTSLPWMRLKQPWGKLKWRFVVSRRKLMILDAKMGVWRIRWSKRRGRRRKPRIGKFFLSPCFDMA
jgi:hypothetical protein